MSIYLKKLWTLSVKYQFTFIMTTKTRLSGWSFVRSFVRWVGRISCSITIVECLTQPLRGGHEIGWLERANGDIIYSANQQKSRTSRVEVDASSAKNNQNATNKTGRNMTLRAAQIQWPMEMVGRVGKYKQFNVCIMCAPCKHTHAAATTTKPKQYWITLKSHLFYLFEWHIHKV